MTNTPKKILLTGAAGFLGSALLRRMLLAGYETAIVLRPSTGLDRITEALPQVERYEADLADFAAVRAAVRDFQPQAIIHLAARYAVSHQPEDAAAFVRDNVTGTVNLLEAAIGAGTGLFVNTGTCFVYRPSAGAVSETDALAPINWYAATKLQAEEACAYYARERQMAAVTLRIFAPYGPGDHERRLIPYTIRSLMAGEAPRMTSGKQRWDFVYVDDVCDAFLRVLQQKWDRDDPRQEIFNIGTGAAVSVREVVERLREICASPVEPQWGAIPHRDNELMYLCADITRAREVLGWQPRTAALSDGLRLTVKGMERAVLERTGQR